MPTTYPCVPGHEIVSRLIRTGAAIGCLVDSGRTCLNCREGLVQHCPGMILT